MKKQPKRLCPNCGKELQQTPGKRAKEYCNSTCRSNYWQKQNRGLAPGCSNIPATPFQGCEPLPAIETVEIKPPPGLKGIDLAIWKSENLKP
jgi:hypothetical protein